MEIPFGQNLPGRLCPPTYDACLRKQGLTAYVFGDGVPLLLLHGNGGSVCSFARLIPLLSRQYRVIVPDLPFHGNGPRADTDFFTDPQVAVRYVWQILDTLEVQDFFAAGHSLGGMIALLVALSDRGKLVKGLMLLDSFVTYPERRPPDLLSMTAFDGDEETNRLIDDAMDDGRAVEWYKTFDASSRLNELSCPVLELIGEARPDTEEAYAAFLVRSRSHVPPDFITRRLPRCGHFLIIEQPEAVAAEMLAFMGRINHDVCRRKGD